MLIADRNPQVVSEPTSPIIERLKGVRADQYSIRINDQYRICFRWEGDDAEDVEIADYHQDWDLWHALRSGRAAVIQALEPLRHAG